MAAGVGSKGVIVSVGFVAGKIGSVTFVSVSGSFLAPSQGDGTRGSVDGPGVMSVAEDAGSLLCTPSPIGAVGTGGGDVLGVASVRALLPRAVFVLLVFRGDRGDLGVRPPRVDLLRSSVAFFSRAACSSGEGMTSLIFLRPEVRFSTSSDGGI